MKSGGREMWGWWWTVAEMKRRKKGSGDASVAHAVHCQCNNEMELN